MPSTPNDQANPYETSPIAPDDGPSVFSTITPWFVAAIILTGSLFAGVLLTQDPFLKIYDDFDARLPTSTILMMSPWSLFAAGLLLFTTITKQFAVPNRVVVRLWNALACIVAILFGLFYVMAAFLPLVGLVGAL